MAAAVCAKLLTYVPQEIREIIVFLERATLKRAWSVVVNFAQTPFMDEAISLRARAPNTAAVLEQN
jgi:hypothetical protein